MRISLYAPASAKATLQLSAESFNSDKKHSVPTVQQNISVRSGDNKIKMELPMGEGFLTWDEFDPALYKLTATLTCGKEREVKEVQFGMREFTIKEIGRAHV